MHHAWVCGFASACTGPLLSHLLPHPLAREPPSVSSFSFVPFLTLSPHPLFMISSQIYIAFRPHGEIDQTGAYVFRRASQHIALPPRTAEMSGPEINPCISYKQEKEKGAPLFYWGADCTKDSICFGGHHPDLLWGSNFSISALLPPPLWFLCHLSLCYMCVSGPLFPILFSSLFYSCIIFSYLAPCCLPPLPPARCFYSEALTQKKRELMNHLQLF